MSIRNKQTKVVNGTLWYRFEGDDFWVCEEKK
jgi:hypothetical protein